MFDLITYLNGFIEKVKAGQSIPIQKEWERVRDEMVVHTKGEFPTKIVDETRPNEPKAIKEYRAKIYEPVTKYPINKAIDSLSRVLSSSNARVEMPSDLKEYLSTQRFHIADQKGVSEPMSFMALMSKVVLRLDIEDPNGRWLWMPVHPNQPDVPARLTMENEQISIAAVYVQSSQIVDANAHVLSFKARETGIVTTSNGTQIAKPIYWIYTQKEVVKATPSRIKEDGTVVYDFDLWYQYSTAPEGEASDFPQIPAIVLGGEIMQDGNGWSFYESYFSGYVPPANDCIRAKTDDDAVRVRANFPIVEEKGQKCPTCNGAGSVSKDGGKETCSGCNGQRVISVSKGPFSTLVNEPPSNTDHPDWLKKAAIQFHSPDVDILKRSNETWREFLRDAEKAVNLQFIEEAQSGEAKKVDREQKFDMLTKISQNFYLNIIKNSLEIIQAYLVVNPSERERITVGEPTSFSLKTSDDIYQEIGEMGKNGVPAPMILNSIRQLSSKLYNDDPVGSKIMEVLEVYDSAITLTPTEVNQLKASGGLTTRDAVIHSNGYKVMRLIANDLGDAKFIESDISALIELADDQMDKIVESNKPFVIEV